MFILIYVIRIITVQLISYHIKSGITKQRALLRTLPTFDDKKIQKILASYIHFEIILKDM